MATFKRIGLQRKRADLSHEQFVAHWVGVHAELAKRLPRLRRYSINVVDRTRNPEVAARVNADIARLKLDDRVHVLGTVSDGRINTLYGESDVFVLASRFEGYGMAYAEALAHGLPVIGTTGGATPETVPRDAGILVAPDDVTALAGALRLVISSKAERERMASAAWTAAAALPTWQESARLFAAAIEAAA